MAIAEERQQHEASDPRKPDVALREFVERVQQIPEIVAVETFGIGPNVRVVVPAWRSEAEESVYALERKILNRYPESGLDVWVSPPAPDVDRVSHPSGSQD